MLRTRSGIILPDAADAGKVALSKIFRCMTPGCGEAWPDTRNGKAAYEAHVPKCAARNMEEIRQSSPRVIAPGIYGDSGVDTEYRDYIKARYPDGAR